MCSKLDVDYILGLFGDKEQAAKRRYREFVQKGIAQGRRTDLTGGGLVRSQGGWAAIKALRRSGAYQKGDERMSGDGDFVEKVLSHADEQLQEKYRMQAKRYDVEKLIEHVPELMDISPEEIAASGKNRKRTQARSILCYWATDRLGISQTQLAHLFRLTQPAVSQAVRRGRDLMNGYFFIECDCYIFYATSELVFFNYFSSLNNFLGGRTRAKDKRKDWLTGATI